MGLQINTNVAALNAQRNLSVTNYKLGTLFEQLSSGLRVNRAADDAAGLAISEKMRAQIRGMHQGQRNAQDGISMLQTTEGALNEVHSILQRMRELSVQAGNTTLSSSDRQALGEELDAASTALPAPADAFSTTVDMYDSLGAPHAVTVKFTKAAAANTWDVQASGVDLTAAVNGVPAQVVFNGAGKMTTPAAGTPITFALTLTAAAANGATAAMSVSVNADAITQFAAPGTVAPTFNNGFSAGSLVSFSVGPGGDITGIFSNGTTRTLGQIAMANFTNAAGLQRAGSNNFEATSNSGVANVGTPGTGGRGSVGAGVLEGSNTDLAREFTNVVIAQRGFQASSNVISTADQMLDGLVNLIR